MPKKRTKAQKQAAANALSKSGKRPKRRATVSQRLGAKKSAAKRRAKGKSKKGKR